MSRQESQLKLDLETQGIF